MSGVTLLAIAAAAGVVMTPWAFHPRTIRRFSWETQFKSKDTRVRRISRSIVTLACVVLAGRAFGLASAAVSALLIDGIYAYATHRGYRGMRDLHALCLGVDRQPSDEAVAALGAGLARYRLEIATGRGRYTAWADWTLYAARIAWMSGHSAEASRWIDGISPTQLDPDLQCRHAVLVAALAIQLGDRKRAHEALAHAPPLSAQSSAQQECRALEGLLEALEGDPAAALVRAKRALAARPEEGEIACLIWLFAAAHALEATHAPEARELLYNLQGSRLLQLVAGQRGPASASAALLIAPPSPYR